MGYDRTSLVRIGIVGQKWNQANWEGFSVAIACVSTVFLLCFYLICLVFAKGNVTSTLFGGCASGGKKVLEIGWDWSLHEWQGGFPKLPGRGSIPKNLTLHMKTPSVSLNSIGLFRVPRLWSDRRHFVKSFIKWAYVYKRAGARAKLSFLGSLFLCY